ncbi:hypothetical protein DICPUDRAFT_86979 [Dictyostelium purpureum]|uniref:Rab-GAP TBC domain-containing protein n=1 Tax=Dictyostelium purpureum TaxID=5786 RepID=F0ZF55_DICPU|nr:uncharacterized protein DICPUDRAFT_86979 [Dictyostelium purpureum]EGC37416.1 hypothetical protein DICPUDRAFT_86979 [Dictyostelium purpureum]|eukprot:XP_003286069.1 hypothetical protein DICPUDRAFT_86979 [Dictyostelium purpureum]
MDDDEYRYSKQCYCWGRDSHGNKTYEPEIIPELNNKFIVQLSCGSNHSLALSDGGDLYSWGSTNLNGQLGHGDSKSLYEKPKNIKKFSLIKALNGDSPIQVSTGLDFSFILTDQGSIYAWGSNIEGQLALGADPISTSLNSSSESNKSFLQPKDILTVMDSYSDNCPFFNTESPTDVMYETLTSSTSSIRSYVTISKQQNEEAAKRSAVSSSKNGGSMNPFSSVGSFFKDIIKDNGSSSSPTSSPSLSSSTSSSLSSSLDMNTLYSHLGNDFKHKGTLPLKIHSFQNICVSQISCGSNHVLCLNKQGQVYSWGNTEHGKLGHGDDFTFVSSNAKFINYPKRIKSLEATPIISISCGYSHCMVLTKDSGIMTWGKGSDGQLGTGHRHDIWSPYEIKRVIGFDEKIVQISCGYFNSFFITLEKRELYSFGWGITLGKLDDQLLPTKFIFQEPLESTNNSDYDEINGNPKYKIKQVSSGYSHTLILNENGECFSLGQGEFGQLGIPQDHPSISNDSFLKSPVLIEKLLPYYVESVQCGRWHSLAIVSNRELQKESSEKQNKKKQTHCNNKKSSTTDLEMLEEFESNLEEIERMINQTVSGYSNNKDDIFDGLQLSFEAIIGFLNENKTQEDDSIITTNDEFEKSFFFIQQDYIGNKNDHDDDEDDFSYQNKQQQSELPQEQKSKPFLDFLFKSKSPHSKTTSAFTNGIDVDSSEEQEHIIQLLLTKFLPKFDVYSKRKEWKQLWRKGFPPAIRGILWKKAIGNKLEINGALYHGLLAQLSDLQERLNKDKKEYGEGFEANLPPNLPKEYQTFIKTNNMVEVDLPRTFPQLKLFAKYGALYEQLKNMLLLFSLYSPQIGYVQGMSYLAGILCLFMDPFESFVCFTNFLNNHYFNSLFRMDIKGIVKHVKIFDFIFKNEIPKLYEKFCELGLSTEHFLLEWFMTLFTKQLPLNIVFRIWDCYIMEGESFIYSTSIGILKLCKKFILLSNFEESLNIIKSTPHDLKEDDLFDSIKSIKIHNSVKKIINLVNKDYS